MTVRSIRYVDRVINRIRGQAGGKFIASHAVRKRREAYVINERVSIGKDSEKVTY